MRLFTAVLTALLTTGVLHAKELPIFDAHLHYSHDAWDMLPVDNILEILRKAGVKRALVSSSGDAGQQRLYNAAPDVIVPALRPYRRRGEIGSWMPQGVDMYPSSLRNRTTPP